MFRLELLTLTEHNQWLFSYSDIIISQRRKKTVAEHTVKRKAQILLKETETCSI